MGRSAKRSQDDPTTAPVRAADTRDRASRAPSSDASEPDASATDASATDEATHASSDAPSADPPASGPDHVCPVAFCPIGLALSAADRVQPDVVSHLLVAGREFFLAAKAVMDVRADDLGGDAPPEGPARMEHIRIG
jgi:hypothetical protein